MFGCSSLSSKEFFVTAWFLAVGLASLASGQDVNYWVDGGGTEDWFAGNNWSQGTPPDDTEFALFDEGGYDLIVTIGANEARMEKFRVGFIPGFSGHSASESEIEIEGVSADDSFFIALAGIELIGEPERQFLEFKNLSISAGDNVWFRVTTHDAADRGRLDFLSSGAYAERGFLLEGSGQAELNVWSSVLRGDPGFVSEISATGRLQASRSTIDTPIENEGHWDVYDDTTFQGKQLTGSGTVELNTEFQFLTFDPSGADTVNVTNAISGPGGVKIDSGTVEFATSNSFTGGLQLHGGVLRASGGARLGGLSNYLQFSGGTLQATGNFTISIPVFSSGGGIDTNGNSVGITGDMDGSTDGVFTKSGAGTLTLDNNGSEYSGSYVVAEGTLISGIGDTFSNRSQVTVNPGATLRFEQSENFEALNGGGLVEVNGKTIKLGYSDTLMNDFAGQLTGGGVVEKLGEGLQRFSGDNSGFTGTFLLNDGALAFGSGASLGRDLSVPSNAMVVFDPQSGSTDLDHSILGGGLWFKEGAGTLNVSEDSPNFTGLMSIGEGRLNVDAQLNPAELVVTAAGTLGGNGAVDGLVFAEEGSALSPGRSVGKLTVGSLQMLEDAQLVIEFETSGGIAGADFDQLVVDGAAAINDAKLVVRLGDGFAPSHGDEFQVLNVGGATSGTGFTTFDFEEAPGMVWDTSNLMTTGTIAIAVTLPGDYNLDGTLSAADYTVWRDHLGMPAGTLPSDIDGGVIGAAQYATWRSNYDQSTGLSTTATGVPEPGSLLLLAISAMVVRGVRGRSPKSPPTSAWFAC